VEVKKQIKHSQSRTSNAQRRSGFTLIELLVVITIIAILIGLLFPAFRGVQDQAKRTQAKNDVTQIVTAVNAFYTEYGKYPSNATTELTVGPGGTPATNETVINVLRGVESPVTLNTRQIVFISPPDVKDPMNPKSGVVTQSGATTVGQYFDPWGKNYAIRIDADYGGDVLNPYTSNAGGTNIRTGAIAWSLGKDGLGGSGDKKSANSDDDVISWQ
jgi:prepilin-type N-terminal cleavage/methylation domain-containing protein